MSQFRVPTGRSLSSMRNTTTTTSFSLPPTPSINTQALVWYLRNTRPDVFHASLINAIQPNGAESPTSSTPRGETATAPQHVIDALFTALQWLGFHMGVPLDAVHHTEERHCKRCHKPYVEATENDIYSCVVKHSVARTVLEVSGERVWPCCQRVLGSVEDKGVEVCVMGRHTTRAENVRYQPNVLDCEVTGCNSMHDVEGQNGLMEEFEHGSMGRSNVMFQF